MGKKRTKKKLPRERGTPLNIGDLAPQGKQREKVEQSGATAEAESQDALQRARQQESDKLRAEFDDPWYDFCGQTVPKDAHRRERILEMVSRNLSSGLITRNDVVSTIKTAINLEDREFRKQNMGDFLSKYAQALNRCDIGNVEEELVDRNLISQEAGAIEYYGISNLVGVPNEGVGPVETYVQKFVLRLLPKTGTPTYTAFVAHIIHMCAFGKIDSAEIPPEEDFELYFGESDEDPMETLTKTNPDFQRIWALGLLYFKRHKKTSHITCFYVMVAKQWAVAFFMGLAKVIAPFVEKANRVQRQRFGPKKKAMELFYAGPMAMPHILGVKGTSTRANSFEMFVEALNDQCDDTTITRSDIWFEVVKGDLRWVTRIGVCVKLTPCQRKGFQEYIDRKSGNVDEEDDFPYWWR